ncbi:MAG: hypothetical protein R3Y56_02325 [Akkermansia sp.]
MSVTFDPEKFTRTVSHDVLAPSLSKFSPAFLTVDGGQVSETMLPDIATASEAWFDIAPISNLVPKLDNKECSVLVATANGGWKKLKVVLNEGMSFEFEGTKMSPEAWQLSYGINEPLNDNEESTLNDGTLAGLEGWLTLGIKRSQDGVDKIKELYAYGLLTMTTPGSITDDFSKPKYTFNVYPNVALATLTPANIQVIATA